MQQRWSEVDGYFEKLFAPSDAVLDATLRTNTEERLPPHDVSPLQGRFLEILVRLTQATRILEIGTLGGYSTIWMARALAPDGLIVTLEAEEKHARVAAANLKRAGLECRVDLRVGAALLTLPAVEADRLGPFDIVFIDADKPSNPDYLTWALRLTRPGSLIVGDNVVRNGAIIDEWSTDPRVRGVQAFSDMIASHPNLLATAIQTVGGKGWDGFAIALVM